MTLSLHGWCHLEILSLIIWVIDNGLEWRSSHWTDGDTDERALFLTLYSLFSARYGYHDDIEVWGQIFPLCLFSFFSYTYNVNFSKIVLKLFFSDAYKTSPYITIPLTTTSLPIARLLTAISTTPLPGHPSSLIHLTHPTLLYASLTLPMPSATLKLRKLVLSPHRLLTNAHHTHATWEPKQHVLADTRIPTAATWAARCGDCGCRQTTWPCVLDMLAPSLHYLHSVYGC